MRFLGRKQQKKKKRKENGNEINLFAHSGLAKGSVFSAQSFLRHTKPVRFPAVDVSWIRL